ncbi:glutamine--fructose-6-phosphate transaminase (isomerizing) [Fenollaria sporofastidiosus]|uniref:glutamine--fructose-6-phosphate transaminase (isomerizing) n=1 Tax=Fenollaria sporofastidiosus TaxID=2811778 RepID=UPI001BFFE700|nr:glutamine--fructose-6-phosphate transaminase (isomerizing) [Fenollaria sporofastidiosus]
MCGIVGYYGKKDAIKHAISGLYSLEYRGYDSSGVAFIKDGFLKVYKRVGRIKELDKACPKEDSDIAIAHTRWATHGAVSETNAHPHIDTSETYAIVHNGVIENYLELKNLMPDFTPKGETDTEVLIEYIARNMKNHDLASFIEALEAVKGSYAILVLDKKTKNLYFAKNGCPLLVSVKNDEYLFASDISAAIELSDEIIYFEDGDMGVINSDGIKIYNGGNEVHREAQKSNINIEETQKDGYEHFMLKEIHEEPKKFKELLDRHIRDGKVYFDELDGLNLNDFDNIYVTGCGTAYHASLLAKNYLERFLERPLIAETASELRYSYNFIGKKTLLIAISQSGETADVMGLVKEAKASGATVLAITNVINSSLDRIADYKVHIFAGPEISVASTKAFMMQILCIYLLGIYFRDGLAGYDCGMYSQIIDELIKISKEMDSEITRLEPIAKEVASKIKNKEKIFFIGRDLDYIAALEVSLKLKEISYINSIAFKAGELKHGSIALIDENSSAIAFANEGQIFEKTRTTMEELMARGAETILVTNQSEGESIVTLKRTFTIFTPIYSVLFGQLMSYYTAMVLDRDIDKPRNLAKSVTVE